MSKAQARRRNYAGFSLAEAMKLVPAERLAPWNLEAPPRTPSEVLQENLRRLESFDLRSSEQAKMLLIDALLAEIVPSHPRMKVWKAAALATDTLVGVADYLLAPNRAYLETPLLCVVEAKRDDFDRGAAQCIAEMVACRWLNPRERHAGDVFGIVSNGQVWQFFRLTTSGQLLESPPLSAARLPDLLGALDYVVSACTASL
jgi:hypothetical protein